MNGENFLEKLRAGLRLDMGKSPENAERRGRNVALTFTFTRHEKPGKTPEGMSADFILPDGLDRMRETGKSEGAEYIMVAGSRDVKRARQTGEAYMQGLNEAGMVELINRDGVEGSKAREFGVYAMDDLNPVANVGKVLQLILAEGKKLVHEGQLDAGKLEGWAIARYLETPDETFRAQGVTTVRETAARIAHRLIAGTRMASRLYADMDTKVNNFTHGPNLECLLKHVIVIDGKTGFDHVSEIGGYFAPGESINFDIQTDEQGNLKPLKIKFRDKEYDVDTDILKTLADEYQQLPEIQEREKHKEKTLARVRT